MYGRSGESLSDITLRNAQERFKKSLERQQVIRDSINRIMQRSHEIVNEMPEFNIIKTGWLQRLRIDKTLIQLDLLGVVAPIKEGSLFGNKKTLCFFDVLPYKDSRDLMQDLPTLLKLHILASQNQSVTTPAKAFIFGLGKSYVILEASPFQPDFLKGVRSQILLMQDGTNFPLSECRMACPYKEQCGAKLKAATVIHKWK